MNTISLILYASFIINGFVFSLKTWGNYTPKNWFYSMTEYDKNNRLNNKIKSNYTKSLSDEPHIIYKVNKPNYYDEDQMFMYIMTLFI